MTTFVLEALVKITLLLTLAWLATALLRRSSAAIRHCVWASAVLACLTLPALMAALPAWRVKKVTLNPRWIEATPSIQAGVTRVWDELPVGNPVRPIPDAKRPVVPRRASLSPGMAIAAVWAAGVALGLLRLLAGYRRVRRIPVERLDLPVPENTQAVRALDPSVMPLTWGLLRPRILFPAGVREWPEQRRNHVLAHELAHIRRGDWATQLAAELLRALLWFHPLTWVATRQLRQEAERACDDAVLAKGANAPDYAEDVVLLARTLHTPPGGISSAVAAAHPTDFERRVSAMLNPSIDRRPVTRLALTLHLLIAAAVLGPLAVLAGGQEIRGKVIDPSTGQPIADAEISITRPTQVGPSTFQMNRNAKLKSDARGEFVYKTEDFGEYFVTATKEGYGGVPRPGALPNMFSSSTFTLDKDNPSRDVQFTLGRRGILAARFVDADTGAPIEGLMFRPFAVGAQNGAFTSIWGGTPVTDAEGNLRYEAVPGNHMLEVLPPLWSIKSAGNNGVVAAHAEKRILREFSAEDAEKTDLDYRFRFLPGGPGLESVLPVPIASGGTVNIGTFRLKKEPFYRARVKIDGACTTGEMLKLTEMIVTQPTSPSSEKSTEFGEVACGSEVLITGLQPREYALEASIGTPPNLRRGLLAFTVGESNLNVTLEVKTPRALEGRIVLSKDAGTIDFTKLAVSAMLMPGVVRPLQDMLPAKMDAGGHFRMENAVTWRRRVGVNGLDNGHYVKEIRYQGKAISGTLLDFTGDGELEIEIDSQPAAVMGTVRDSDKAAPRASVILARWPLTGDPGMVRRVTADASGYFQAAGIAPGEYRIFAVSADDQSAAGEPAAWQRLLARAEKLTLTRGSSQPVNLRASDPSR